MADTHKHKCGSCGTVWEHSNECYSNYDAHVCKCGDTSFHHYHGDEIPEPHPVSCQGDRMQMADDFISDMVNFLFFGPRR